MGNLEVAPTMDCPSSRFDGTVRGGVNPLLPSRPNPWNNTLRPQCSHWIYSSSHGACWPGYPGPIPCLALAFTTVTLIVVSPGCGNSRPPCRSQRLPSRDRDLLSVATDLLGRGSDQGLPRNNGPHPCDRNLSGRAGDGL